MMEKTMKERIIGAIVLVAVAVLIVPVFLDGPPGDGEIISEVIPLPGQSDQKTQTIVLDRDRKEPVPVPSAAAPDRREQGPATTASAPRKSAPASQEDTSQPQRSQDRPDSATATPLTSAGSTTGMWAVQLGSFSNPQNAEKLAADLRAQGFAAFLSQRSTSSGELHRVRVGPQKDREAAEAMAARLQQVGHTGRILPHP